MMRKFEFIQIVSNTSQLPQNNVSISNLVSYDQQLLYLIYLIEIQHLSF